MFLNTVPCCERRFAMNADEQARTLPVIVPGIAALAREIRAGGGDPRAVLTSTFDSADSGTGHAHRDMLIRLGIADGSIDPTTFNMAVDAAMLRL